MATITVKFLTAGQHSHDVPSDATNVTAWLYSPGSPGGGGGSSGVGGAGAGGVMLKGSLAAVLVAGKTLTIDVGGPGGPGQGGSTSGSGGGGSGSSAIRDGGTVLAEAGAPAAGGAGDNSSSTAGGAGGAAGRTSGATGGASSASTGGTGGDQVNDGNGGTGAGNGANGSSGVGGAGGESGTEGQSGGAGGTGFHAGGEGGYEGTNGLAGGGGGGGGFRGGGGGGSSTASDAGGAGGGGASCDDGSLTSITFSANSGLTGGGQGESVWESGHGDGGAGGATTANGGTAEPGMVVLQYDSSVPGITSLDRGTSTVQEPLRTDDSSRTAVITNGDTVNGYKVWFTNNAVWGSETTKVEQTATSKTATGFTLEVVPGALVEGIVHMYIENDPDGTPVVSPSFPVFMSESHIWYEVSKVNLANGTGVQTLHTPSDSNAKCYLVMWDGSTADDTVGTSACPGCAVVVDDPVLTSGAGAWDNQAGICTASTHAADEDQRSQNSTDALIIFADAGDATLDVVGSLSINSSTGALEANLSVNDNSGYRLVIMAFGGRTLRARLYEPAVSDGSVTGIDFPNNPDLLFCFGTGAQWGQTTSNGIYHMGWFDGTNSWWSGQHWSTIANSSSALRTSAVAGQLVGTSITWEMTSPAFSADAPNRQFTWSDSNADEIGILCLWLDEQSAEVGTFDKETTGVDDVEETVITTSFAPAAMILATAHTTDENQSTTNGARQSWGFYDGTNQFSTNIDIDGNGGGPEVFDSRKILDTDYALVGPDIGATWTPDYEGELQEFSTTTQIRWVTADTTAVDIGVVAMEASPVAAAEASFAIMAGAHF